MQNKKMGCQHTAHAYTHRSYHAASIDGQKKSVFPKMITRRACYSEGLPTPPWKPPYALKTIIQTEVIVDPNFGTGLCVVVFFPLRFLDAKSAQRYNLQL